MLVIGLITGTHFKMVHLINAPGRIPLGIDALIIIKLKVMNVIKLLIMNKTLLGLYPRVGIASFGLLQLQFINQLIMRLDLPLVDLLEQLDPGVRLLDYQ